MKRRLSETAEVKSEPEEVQQTLAALVAQQVISAFSNLITAGSAVRFGRVAFDNHEQQSVNAFLHQKLGKESVARRPGPGGRKLTYIESCKAIELANRAFGFNGWSCHIVECKEEYKEKKGDRWSIAYSSLVRIELKDGTSHEDVGCGTSDGQKDLGAALEQAKKASISDARKRALRLFGEYLGNSCYDKDHIKDVNSNRPMAPVAAAPNVILAGQKQQDQEAAFSAGTMQLGVQNELHLPQQIQVQQQQPLKSYQQQQQIQQRTIHQQAQQQVHQLNQQARPQMPRQINQEEQPQHQQQHWKPPQVMRVPKATAMQHHTQAKFGTSATHSRTSTMQTATSSTTSAAFTTADSVSSPFRPQPQHWVSLNAPPAPRVLAAPAIIKMEQSVAAQAQSNAQFNMEDLSLSQFDFDPNKENDNPAKKMRS